MTRCRCLSRWLRYLWAAPVYRLTRRMPGKCPRRDLYRMGTEDAITFGRLAGFYLQRGVYAPDPQRERRRR